MKLLRALLTEKEPDEFELAKLTSGVDLEILVHSLKARNMSVKYFGIGLMHVMQDIIRDVDSRYEKKYRHKTKVLDVAPHDALFLEAAYYPGNQSIYGTLEWRARVKWSDAGSTTEKDTLGFVNHSTTFKPIGYEEAYSKIHDDDSLDLRELLETWLGAPQVQHVFKPKL